MTDFSPDSSSSPRSGERRPGCDGSLVRIGDVRCCVPSDATACVRESALFGDELTALGPVAVEFVVVGLVMLGFAVIGVVEAGVVDFATVEPAAVDLVAVVAGARSAGRTIFGSLGLRIVVVVVGGGAMSDGGFVTLGAVVIGAAVFELVTFGPVELRSGGSWPPSASRSVLCSVPGEVALSSVDFTTGANRGTSVDFFAADGASSVGDGAALFVSVSCCATSSVGVVAAGAAGAAADSTTDDFGG